MVPKIPAIKRVTGEMIFVNAGLSFARDASDASIKQRQEALGAMVEERKLDLRPAIYVKNLMDLQKSVVLHGTKGVGKSTTLQMLSYLIEKPFVYFDGHMHKTGLDRLKLAFEWARNNRAVFLWDAFDYITLGPPKYRKLSRKQHWQRTLDVLLRTQKFISNGGIFVGTQHDDSWLRKRSNPYLLQLFQDIVYPLVEVVRLPLQFNEILEF